MENLNRYSVSHSEQDRKGPGRESTAMFGSILLSVSVIILLSFLISCANQLPPGGGEQDIIPPEIISNYPPDGTVNFSDNYFELEFSEYVDKRSFKEAIFISPFFDEKMEINWSGKSVEIVLPDGLKKDLTYVITIGTDVVDVNNRNRMAHSYSFSFSTGDKIDTRSVSGRVFGKDTEGTLIFAYKFTDDTTNYLDRKPDYLSQTGKDGSYRLNGLAESVYRIFAVKDQLRDFIYQVDQDMVGLPFMDISLTGKDSSFSGMNFFVSKTDTVSPRLISSIMTDRNHILVSLSEECDTSVVNPGNFFIYDSTLNKKLNLSYAYKGNTKKEEIILVQSNELSQENKYFLIAEDLKDLSGNIYKRDSKELIISERADTIAPRLYRKIPEQSAIIDFSGPKFQFFFDDAISNGQIKNGVSFEDTLKNKIPFNLKFIDDGAIEISPVSDLKPDRKYLLNINLSYFRDAAGNKTDSSYVHRFSTISGIEFTGLSGRVSSVDENITIVLQDHSNSQVYYTAKPDNTAAYNFERINAGTYHLWYYFDEDSSGSYNAGYPYPFEPAEEFHYYQDTLKLRARWSLTDYDLNIRQK